MLPASGVRAPAEFLFRTFIINIHKHVYIQCGERSCQRKKDVDLSLIISLVFCCRMRISWVVLTTLVMAAASAASSSQDQDKSLSAAVLSVTRALQDGEAKVPALLHCKLLHFFVIKLPCYSNKQTLQLKFKHKPTTYVASLQDKVLPNFVKIAVFVDNL
jgi:hypothetical protein